MSYFRFYIYKAIRKVLFLPIFPERSYEDLFFFFLVLTETSMIKNLMVLGLKGVMS